MDKNTIVIAADHAGFELKEEIKKLLDILEYEVVDFGTNSTDSMDYPDVIHPIAKTISDGNFEKGIIICGSGNGVSMTANKHENVRAALCWNVELGKLSRLHNDANLLALPARYIEKDLAKEIVTCFLETDLKVVDIQQE